MHTKCQNDQKQLPQHTHTFSGGKKVTNGMSIDNVVEANDYNKNALIWTTVYESDEWAQHAANNIICVIFVCGINEYIDNDDQQESWSFALQNHWTLHAYE